MKSLYLTHRNTAEILKLWLIHWPVAFKNGNQLFPLKEGDDGKTALDQEVTLSQTWEAVTKLPKEKVRSIGVSNFNKEMVSYNPSILNMR